jgi:hypothetical protein
MVERDDRMAEARKNAFGESFLECARLRDGQKHRLR